MSEKTSTTGERRSHPRVEVHFPLESVLLGNVLAGMRGFATETLDLGEGGARFGVPEELPMGQELALVVRLPGGTHHRCRARVLRSSPTSNRVGESGAWAAVQFIDPAEEMRAAIAELITAAERDEGRRRAPHPWPRWIYLGAGLLVAIAALALLLYYPWANP